MNSKYINWKQRALGHILLYDNVSLYVAVIGGSSGLGTNASLAGNFAALPQRGAVSGPQFRGNNSTPTSMNLPYNLQQPQQQPSPSR